MNEERLVTPQLLKGFRDYLPAQMIARQKILETIRKTYELYGFVPLETPALEHLDTLLGYGEDASKQIFQFTAPDGKKIGLRFDLTVPLARVFSQYRDLPKPFRRYQVSPVWRFDKPGPGRFREFIQFDIDTVGSPSMEADAEIIAAMCDTLDSLGIPRFCVKFNSRKVLNSLIVYAAIPAVSTLSVFRVIDKLDRVGIEGIKLELAEGRTDASGDKIHGLGLEPKQIESIESFLSLPRGGRTETIKAASRLLSGVPGTEEGINELREISNCLDALGITDDRARIDLTVARGLDYYTGPVYEAIILDAPKFGSVMGGGRYDRLVERFLGEKVPATGASIGVDRLFAAMQQLGLVGLTPSTAQVLVTVMDDSKLSEYRRMANELRKANIRTELYVGTERNLGKQLFYCNRQNIPIAVIAGSDEFNSNTVTIKDMRKLHRENVAPKDRKHWLKARVGQSCIARKALVPELRNMLRQPHCQP